MRLTTFFALLLCCSLPTLAGADYVYVSQFGSFGSGNGQFDAPRGLGVLSTGRIAISESGNHRIQNCTSQGICFDFGEFGVDTGFFDRPRGVAINSADRIIVADRGNDRIQLCLPTGSCDDLGGSGTAVGQFDSPRGVAVTADDRIVVADTDNDRIQICTELGACTAFGSTGTALGRFISPAGVAVNSQGQLIIADRGNNRIQVCSQQGNCTAFGSFGSAPGQFDSPAGVAVDSQDRIFIVDRFNDRVQVCSAQGNCSVFGSTGSGNGQFNLPWGVAVDAQDRILVADLGNNRIQIFAEQAVVAIDSFTASPATIEAGQSTLLSWSVSNATQCTPSGGTPAWTSLVLNPVSGNASIQVDIAGNYLFTIECSNPGGTVSRSVTVTVTQVTPDFLINAGLNDAWVNIDTLGQGFFVNVFPVIGRMFVAWFTYDTMHPDASVTAVLGGPGQRWITAFGPYSGNSAVLTIELTTGGVFNSPLPEVDQVPYGTLTIIFHDCSTATITYQIPSLGLDGVVPVQRAVGDNNALCQALAAE